jgi:pilus assembly protein CpaB
MGRMRGCLWLTAGLVVAVLAGAVAFITLNRALGTQTGGGVLAGPQVQVVVAARTIEVRAQLAAEDLELKEFPVEAAPEGYVGELEEAVGRITLVELYPGEVILAQRLVDPNVISGDGRLALVVVEDQVLMAFPARDLMSQVGVLKPGDHVDMLFSLDFPVARGLVAAPAEGEEAEGGGAGAGAGQQEEQATFNLLQNVTIAAIVTAPSGEGQAGEPEAILLTVSPQDALLLKYAKDAGGEADIVLRAPGAEGPFDTDPVDVDYMINRYRIPTEVGR